MDLGEALEPAGLQTMACATLSEARQSLSAGSFGLIILDVILPDGDGIDFLQEIRRLSATAKTPVMLLSSAAEVGDRILGLNSGADEYVGKPYDLSYVVARALELVRQPGSDETAPSTVLIIDDSPTFREELKSALESDGHWVITASTGEEGLRVAVDARPALIIVDGVLPGIDGATVIRRVRDDAALRRTPCILLTASEGRTGELKAFDAGADDYVRKGDDTAIILARVNAVLRSARAPSAVGPTSSLLGPKKILVVDDSITYLEETAEQLRQIGYEVIPAHSGEEAIALLAAQSVDCILLDLVMPGMSGQQTCRHIKSGAAWRDIPLIMHTSLDEKNAMIEGINEGADDFIPKSSDLEVLQARIKAQLRRKQFEEENRNIRERLLQKELEITAANSARELAETRAAFVEELKHKNDELEAFCYSVSHDLRTPLRAIQGFSQLLLQDHADQLDGEGQDHLNRVCTATQRMSELIDDLLLLSRIGRVALTREHTDISHICGDIAEQLQTADSSRQAPIEVEDGLITEADSRLIRVALENLLGNAWKYSTKVPRPKIQVGSTESEEGRVFFVRDNGAGFDMRYADKLFRPFQRLHVEEEFSGTGIGLATVHRIVERHGGRIWAESAVGQGATFYFTIPPAKPDRIGDKSEIKAALPVYTAHA